MFMLSNTFVIVCDLFELMRIYIVFVLSADICIVSVDPVIKMRRVGIPLTSLTPPYSHAYPRTGSGFPTQYVEVLCLFNSYWLRCELVVSFVDVGGIVEHYCLILGGPECFSIGVSRITCLIKTPFACCV